RVRRRAGRVRWAIGRRGCRGGGAMGEADAPTPPPAGGSCTWGATGHDLVERAAGVRGGGSGREAADGGWGGGSRVVCGRPARGRAGRDRRGRPSTRPVVQFLIPPAVGAGEAWGDIGQEGA